MALLQISEPGQAPNPHERRIAVGIDLGTTHSLVAAVRHGVAECLPDEAGQVLLPSVVRYLPGNKRLIGHAAQAPAGDEQEAANTIASVKRLMGRSLADVQQASGHLSYRLVDQPGMVAVDTVHGLKSPVEVSAEILATLRQRAEDSFDDELYGAVITVPAYFDDAQRQATKDAAQLAGLNVLRLINEPTAAAIAYGLDNAAEGVYAVFDLGGGTFDVSILRLSQGVFEVMATAGDSALGGDDYDAALRHWAVAQTGQSEATADERLAQLAAARQAKEALTEALATDMHWPRHGGTVTLKVTREAFEAATQALTARCLRVLHAAMADANLAVDDVAQVVMVGGATRMPQIRAAVAQVFGRPPLTDLNPDEVVALGAAVQANQLAGNNPDGELLLLDVIPLSLGLETMGGLVERIVPRNQTIPTAMAQDFTTYQDGQTALALHVVQGERDLVADCRSLARFELRGIPPMAAGAARIRVTFTVDADGLLSVDARETTSGVEARIDVKPSYGLSDEQIAQMLQDGFATAQADMAARALVEAKVDADRLLMATESALAADGQLLQDDERAAIDRLLAQLRQTMLADDATAAAIEAASEALAKGTEAFAAERMNQNIQKALAGKSIQSL
ncbi:Fe-S protein assembly chaperone HscA [Comamonas serinivorans]|uniref:Chaperone protein HscA homolog n=1 Tax=Comamonas serinivorans TaxID=1082851 RepID=A0A1Y0EQ26_9BURK|nr:Fe-S protein assembly chaperone HscA [Comamonas serinivorans]ARU05501.1 Fe-S protein assembly chaperone HscA [Comamonas serinivorans]